MCAPPASGGSDTVVDEEEETPSDSVLLFRMIQGDESAYRLLIRRYSVIAYRVALLTTESTADAEEAAASAIFELWRKRAKVRIVEDSIRPWLLKTVSYMAKNQIRGRLRYQQMLRSVRQESDYPDHADEVAQALDGLHVAAEVREALASLDAKHAAVVVLCVVEEMSIREAAVFLAVPEGTVKSRLSRAKVSLRSTLRRYAPGAGGVEA